MREVNHMTEISLDTVKAEYIDVFGYLPNTIDVKGFDSDLIIQLTEAVITKERILDINNINKAEL
jgi:hypothetical protein